MTIDGYPVVEEGSMFERGMYLSIFIVYVLLIRNQWIYQRNRFWKKDTWTWTRMMISKLWTVCRSTAGMLLSMMRKGVKFMPWGRISTKTEGGVYKEIVLVSFPHPKGGNIVWNCVKDNIFKETKDYEDIGIREFDYKLFK